MKPLPILVACVLLTAPALADGERHSLKKLLDYEALLDEPLVYYELTHSVQELDGKKESKRTEVDFTQTILESAEKAPSKLRWALRRFQNGPLTVGPKEIIIRRESKGVFSYKPTKGTLPAGFTDYLNERFGSELANLAPLLPKKKVKLGQEFTVPLKTYLKWLGKERGMMHVEDLLPKGHEAKGKLVALREGVATVEINTQLRLRSLKGQKLDEPATFEQTISLVGPLDGSKPSSRTLTTSLTMVHKGRKAKVVLTQVRRVSVPPAKR